MLPLHARSLAGRSVQAFVRYGETVVYLIARARRCVMRRTGQACSTTRSRRSLGLRCRSGRGR
jgi:hypothetical protein